MSHGHLWQSGGKLSGTEFSRDSYRNHAHSPKVLPGLCRLSSPASQLDLKCFARLRRVISGSRCRLYQRNLPWPSRRYHRESEISVDIVLPLWSVSRPCGSFCRVSAPIRTRFYVPPVMRDPVCHCLVTSIIRNHIVTVSIDHWRNSYQCCGYCQNHRA